MNDPVNKRDTAIARIRAMRQQARYYLDQAVMSMNMANEERDKWILQTGDDLTVESNPHYKKHAADNRWYMEWARVYDNRAQTEMIALQMGIYG